MTRQVTVELYPPASIFTQAAGATNPPAANLALSAAQFQVQQVMLNNQSDALARRVDMANNAYSYPCEFVQQVQRIQLANTAQAQSVTLTGFRSGEVKAIHCWLSRASDVNAGGINNPFNWRLPLAVQVTYAGDVYARYELGSSPLWNLINGNKAPVVDNVISADAGGGALAAPAASTSFWVELPFAQTLVDEDAHSILVHGKPITNGKLVPVCC